MGKEELTNFSTDVEAVQKEHYCLQGPQASSTRPCDK